MSTPLNDDYDLSTLYEIASGSKEFVVETLTLFITQTAELFDDMSNALEIKDWKRLAETAHKAKSNLGFFGMHRAEALIQQVETAARMPEQTEDIEPVFNELRQSVFTTIDKLYQLKLEEEAGS